MPDIPELPNTLKQLIGMAYMNASYGLVANRVDFTDQLLTHMAVASGMTGERMAKDDVVFARDQFQRVKGLMLSTEDHKEIERICSAILISMGKYIFRQERPYGTIDVKSFNPVSFSKEVGK